MSRRTNMKYTFAAILGILIIGCGSAPPTNTCAPGQTISCPCLGGSMGVQTCQASGAYNTCLCPSQDSGISDTSPVDSGTPDTSVPVDSGTPDTFVADTSIVDVSTDSGTPDTTPPIDSGAPDTSVTDTSVVDSGVDVAVDSADSGVDVAADSGPAPCMSDDDCLTSERCLLDSHVCWNISTSLILFFKFNGNSRDEVSGSSFRVPAPLVPDRHGNPNMAAHLEDGWPFVLSAEHPLPIDDQPRTIALWFRTIGNASNFIVYGAPALALFRFGLSPAGLYAGNYETGIITDDSGTILNDSAWHFVAMSYNGGYGTTIFYSPGVIHYTSVGQRLVSGPISRIEIGVLRADYDDFRIYNTALTIEQLTALSRVP